MSPRIQSVSQALSVALLALVPLASTAAPVLYTGTLKLTYKVTLKSNDIPPDIPIYCSVQVLARQQHSVTNHSQTTKWTESKRNFGTRNGSKVTCVVNVPYSWRMDDALVPNYRLSASVGTATTTVAEYQRNASGYDFPEDDDILEPIPPDGATTTFDVAYVL